VAADALAPGQATAGAVETQFGYHYIVRDDPAKAADIEAKVKRGVGRSMYAKATSVDASKKLAQQILASMQGGKSADDAIRDALAGIARPAGKIEHLKVLPPPPSAADAGAAPPSPAAVPEKSFDASVDGDRPQVQTSSAFNRGGDPFPGLSPDATTSVMEFAFASQDGAIMKEPVRLSDAYVVVQMKQRKTATREDFAKDTVLLPELVANKRDEALSLYVRRLRDQAKNDIRIETSFIQEAKVDGGAGGGPEEEDEY
jgi:hypothetical protein